MKIRDFIIILSVLVLAAVSYFLIPKAPADLVRITVDGNIYMTASLQENREIKIKDTNVAEVKDGTIFMKSATCPDKLCIHQGAISDSSKKIVCLPNKVIIEVILQSDIDTVVK